MLETRLILVRHGESVAQTEGIVGGHQGCRGLTTRGREQVALLRRRWTETEELGRVAALYTSLMPRALETAELLAPAVGRLTIEQDCAFCEHHPGAGDGLTWGEFEARFPLPEGGWHPDLRRDDDGETWREMAARVAAGLDVIVERHAGETVVIACHGGVIVHSLIRWLGLADPSGNGDEAWFHPENASITEWHFSERPWGSNPAGWRLVRFNDHAHLPVAGG